MKPKLELVDVDSTSAATLPCCGIRNPAHEGRQRKLRWWTIAVKHGARAKVLLTPDRRQCGYIEYLPGEFAWRGVEATGYMFIHCIWTFYKRYQKQGYAASMVEACLEDARAAGMNGVAVVARDGPWLAGSDLFLKLGFAQADAAPPDYHLLVRKLDPSAEDPRFKTGWDRKVKRFAKGLTIIRADQCPHAVKFADEIARVAKACKLKPRVVELKSCHQAQNAPTPYAVFAVIHDGRVLADHQVSATRFRNIVRREIRPATRAARR